MLLASGYIAGGALAGIIIALITGVMTDVDAKLTKWANESNPFYAGPHSDLLALLPFAVLTVFLCLVGFELVLTQKDDTA